MKNELKFIDIFRIHNGEKSKSSLEVSGDELKVLGVLPNGCKIEMSKESAKQLIDYISKTYLEND